MIKTNHFFMIFFLAQNMLVPRVLLGGCWGAWPPEKKFTLAGSCQKRNWNVANYFLSQDVFILLSLGQRCNPGNGNTHTSLSQRTSMPFAYREEDENINFQGCKERLISRLTPAPRVQIVEVALSPYWSTLREELKTRDQGETSKIF